MATEQYLTLEKRLNDDPSGQNKREVISELKEEELRISRALNSGLKVEDYNAYNKYLTAIHEAIDYVETRWNSGTQKIAV